MADQQNTQQIDPAAQRWNDAITAYEREFKKWTTRNEKIVKMYRDFDQTQGQGNDGSFNILWSNVQVQLPAVFARLPKPDVSRRFRDNDQVGRVAALLLERGLDFEVDHYPNYRATMEACVLDRFLGGRGQAWIRYEADIITLAGDVQQADQVTEDTGDAGAPLDAAQAQPQEQISNECAPIDYVNWKDFGHTVARTWEEVSAVWRRVYMDRPALEKRFGANIARTIPLDTKPTNTTDGKDMSDVQGKQACIYEIWDKDAKVAIWYSKSLNAIIDTKSDPLGLDGFFPCPRPLYSTITNESLVPVPDYKYYQDQAKQLTKLQTKIDGLIDMLELKGVYDAAVPELARLFKEGGNGTLLPSKNWAQFTEKNGLAGSLDLVDLAPIVNALNIAYDQLDKVKNTIYELMGISDITRGASDPTETYGAQKLKGQYGNMRLRNQQARVTQFATELLQLKAQVMCKHFQPDTLARIAAADQLNPTDQAMVPQAMELLIGERVANPGADTTRSPLASFRIEVSSDSMIQMDEAQEKADRTEFLKGVGSYLQQALPVIESQPQAGPMLVGLLKFGVSGFKVGKTIEGMFDAMLDQMQQAAQQPQQPKPDPEMVKLQGQMQLEQVKTQNAKDLELFKTQQAADLATHQQNVQAMENAHQQELESMREDFQRKQDAAMEAMRLDHDRALKTMDLAFQEWKARLDSATKVEVAEVSSKDKIQDTATAASASEVTEEVSK